MKYIKKYNESVSNDFKDFCSKLNIKTGGSYYNDVDITQYDTEKILKFLFKLGFKLVDGKKTFHIYNGQKLEYNNYIINLDHNGTRESIIVSNKKAKIYERFNNYGDFMKYIYCLIFNN